MAAGKNNQFWKLRSKHGRDKIFETPEIMLEAILEAFDKLHDQKLYKTDHVGKDGDEVNIPSSIPFTWQALCIFLHVNTKYFNHFKASLDLSKEVDKDFANVITWAGDVVFAQKFNGAAVGHYNANIIARDLGLSDKIVQTIDTDKKINISIDGSEIDLSKKR